MTWTDTNTSRPLGGYEYIRDYPHVAIPFLCIAGTACIVGTIGNFCILGAVFLNNNLHNARNVFLVNLALADLCVTTIADPFSIVGMVKGRHYFVQRPALCDFIATMCLTVCVTALFSIGGISFNRYFHICHSHVYIKIFTLRNNIIMCMLFWVLGISASLPALVGWSRNVYDHKMLECIWDRTHSLSFTVFFSAIIVLTPASIIGISYLKIYIHVRNSKMRVATEIKSGAIKTNQDRSRSVRLARSLFMIFLVFVSCWLPYAVLVLVDFNDRFPHEVHLYVLLLAHMHSSLNSFIYFYTNQHFRVGYRKLFFILTCRYDRATVLTTKDDNTSVPQATGPTVKN